MRDDLFTVVMSVSLRILVSMLILFYQPHSVEHDDIYNSYGHYTIGTGYKLIEPLVNLVPTGKLLLS